MFFHLCGESPIIAATARTYLWLKYGVQAFPDRVRHPRPAGRGIKAAVRSDWSTNIKHDGYRRPDREAARDRVGYGADRGQELHDRRRGGRLGVLIAGNPSTSCAAGGHGHLLYSTPSHLIEHDGEELRDLPFLDRKAALSRPLHNTEAGTLFNEHLAQDGQTRLCARMRPGVEGIVSKRVDGTCRPGRCPAWIKIGNPASIVGTAGAQRELEQVMGAGC